MNTLGKGIIASLTRRHGGNVDQLGIVRITSSSVDGDDPQFAPGYVAHISGSTFFRSRDEPDQWVCWDFGQERVRLKSYLVSASGLRGWVLEGSADGAYWAEIDRQENVYSFQNGFGQATFPVPARRGEAEFRFIRLRQTSQAHGGGNVLVLSLVEFFGTLA
jgi:hypothetical protein